MRRTVYIIFIFSCCVNQFYYFIFTSIFGPESVFFLSVLTWISRGMNMVQYCTRYFHLVLLRSVVRLRSQTHSAFRNAQCVRQRMCVSELTVRLPTYVRSGTYSAFAKACAFRNAQCLRQLKFSYRPASVIVNEIITVIAGKKMFCTQIIKITRKAYFYDRNRYFLTVQYCTYRYAPVIVGRTVTKKAKKANSKNKQSTSTPFTVVQACTDRIYVMKRKRKSRRQLRLEAAARRNVPDDVNLEDGFAAVSILVNAGMIDIDGDDDFDFDFRHLTRYKTDVGRNIVSLCIGRNGHRNWILSDDVCKLPHLKELYVGFCGQLPKNLNLPVLEILVFVHCGPEFFDDRTLNSLGTVSKSVQVFGISNDDFGSKNISLVIDHASNNFPRLSNLVFSQPEGGDILYDCVLDKLKRNNLVLGEKLVVVSLMNSKLSDDQLATILSDGVVARYDHLRVLDFRNNEIKSLRVTAEKIINIPHESLLPNTIECLLLQGNSVVEKIKSRNDTDEKKALLTILSCLQRVRKIESLDIPLCSYSPDIEYALRINAAGRILLEGNNNNDVVCDNNSNNYNIKNDDSTNANFVCSSDGKRNTTIQQEGGGKRRRGMIPLSVWPIVLERAYKTSSPGSVKDQRSGQNVRSYRFDATGLHYLIRNGPFINAIATMTTSKQERRRRQQLLQQYPSSSSK